MKSPKSRLILLFAAAVVLSTLWQTPASAVFEVIDFLSGQYLGAPGVAGDPDDLLTYYTEGTGGTSLATVFDTEFAAASSGPAAIVITAHPAWLPGLTLGDSDARWVNVSNDPFSGYGSPSVSTLYAAPFTVTTPGTHPALLQVYYAADDALGDSSYGGPNPEGLYLNGTPLLGSGPGSYATENVYVALVSVSQGLNTLHLYDRDQGLGVSGLIFSARLTIVPEPATCLLAAIGCLGLAIWRSRK